MSVINVSRCATKASDVKSFIAAMRDLMMLRLRSAISYFVSNRPDNEPHIHCILNKVSTGFGQGSNSVPAHTLIV